MPAARIDPSQYPELAHLHVRGNLTHAGISARFGVDASTITRTLKRAPVVALIEVERRREQDALRAKAYRDRQREQAAAADPAVEVEARFGISTTPDRIVRPGFLDLYRHPTTGRWMRTASVGFDCPARPSDFTRREAPVPDDLQEEYGFGPPGYDRPPVGHVPPEQRPIRMRYTNARGVEVTSPVDARDTEQRLSEGWELVEPPTRPA
jgi:hypothetical protein